MEFGDIIGQKEIISGLKSSLKQNRVGHAYIFSGPVGIGKRTVAKIFSKVLLCEEGKYDECCGFCQSCNMMESGSHPDFFQISIEGLKIGIDSIRDIQRDMVNKPLYSDRKVFLITEADKMTVQAQNCLLKTLEDPPGHSVIILTVSNYDSLIETIRSRAVRYSFKNNSYGEILKLLKSRFGSNLKNAGFIAGYANGVIGTALELAENEEFILLREKTLEIIVKLKESKQADIFDMYDFFENNKNSADRIFDIMISFYRDMLVSKNTKNEDALINSDKKDIILSNACCFTVSKLIWNIETVESARMSINKNVNYQLVIEVMLMKLQEEIV